MSLIPVVSIAIRVAALFREPWVGYTPTWSRSLPLDRILRTHRKAL